MTSREIWYLCAQVICILMFIGWIVVLAVKLRKQTHGYYYIILRALWYKDYEPLDWLKDNLIFVDYLVQITALLFITIGFILQIADNTVFLKSPVFFVGTILLALSACRIIIDLSKKAKE